MAIRKVLIDGDDSLNKISRAVEKFDGRLNQLIEDMKDTLAEKNGIGLAAPQIGVLRRIIIIYVEGSAKEFINPEIIYQEGEQRETEGCLSCPNLWGVTVRPMKVTVSAFNAAGERFEFSGEELMARAICHEVDHLNGIIFKERVIEWVEK